MTELQVEAWVAISQLMLEAGIATVGKIKTLIKSFHPGATDEDLDNVIQGVIDDATKRKAVADANS